MKFIQITSAGRRDATVVHGLTDDGSVYEWVQIFDQSIEKNFRGGVWRWVKMENPS